MSLFPPTPDDGEEIEFDLRGDGDGITRSGFQRRRETQGCHWRRKRDDGTTRRRHRDSLNRYVSVALGGRGEKQAIYRGVE